MIRAAIVGLGRWGQNLVASVQGKSDAIRFVAGATRTAEKARGFADQHGFPLHESYEKLLADPAIDAVVLATPGRSSPPPRRASTSSPKSRSRFPYGTQEPRYAPAPRGS